MAPHARLDPTVIRSQIELLRVTHPDIVDDDEMFQLALESETSLLEFLAMLVTRMRETDAMIEGAAVLITDLQERRKRFSDRVDALRKLAFDVMQHADLKKLELAQATLSIRAGVPKVIITDEAALPDGCVRIKREPDKLAIKARLAAGHAVTGAELSNAEPVLAVRTK